jgi:predicted AAA+ superfamily ATPase
MYKRILAPFIKKSMDKYPIIAILGPRQSGKTTLSKIVFSDFKYITLEDPDVRKMAQEDPRGFFKNNKEHLILDEIQRVPDLLSYLQGIVDDPKNKQKFVLTGSHQFLLMKEIGQSLAGRVRIFNLLPLSFQELKETHQNFELERFIFTGGYPRIYANELSPTEWLSQYYQTYVERDLREIIHLKELYHFEKMLKLIAGRVGQLVNMSSIATETGTSQPTIASWLNILELSFLCFTLRPHHKNFNKRIIKTPKIYFYDTGLLCWLLEIKTPNQLKLHPQRGLIFENWIISELMKNSFNKGDRPNFYFWRDQKGHEVDLVFEEDNLLKGIEIKAGSTFQEDWLKGINYLNGLQESSGGTCYYQGDNNFEFKNIKIKKWSSLE